MTALEAFRKCADYGPGWTTAGDAVDYRVERDCFGGLRIFFQPSCQKRDWDNNLDLPADVYRSANPRWRAHRGFARAWRSVEPRILPMMLDPKVTSIEIAGFSMGAAIALLAHEAAFFNGRWPTTYVFGCPRVGWMLHPEVHKRWDGVTRYQMRGDIVGMLPPWLMGYQHVGRVVKLGPMCPPWPWKHEPKGYIKYLGGIA